MKHAIMLLAVCGYVSAIGQVPSAEIQIKNALLAAPDDSKVGAMVYGYNDKSEFIVLRKGTNEMVCIADDPKLPGFSAACYHKDLEPFMERGRELKKQGKNFKEIQDQREADVKAGKFKMPTQPTSLYVFSSQEAADKQTGDVANGSFRYVVYIPYATAETTGLPLKPNPNTPEMPWLMDPGTHRAHIMITPPKR